MMLLKLFVHLKKILYQSCLYSVIHNLSNFISTEISIYGLLICCFSMSASQYQYERGLPCILFYANNVIISSVYSWFWCPNLTFSIYTIQINIVGCCILLDAKKNIPNAFVELLGMNQNKRSMGLLQLVSFQKIRSKICVFLEATKHLLLHIKNPSVIV